MAGESSSLGKVGILCKGAYDSSVAYKEGEYVYYLGSTYIALKNLTAGTTPVNDFVNWMYLAEGVSVDEVLTSIAPVEDSAISTGAYDIGDYLLYNSALYRATAHIDIGDTLTVGTNITAAVMGEDLAAVKAKADKNAEDIAAAVGDLATIEATSTASKAYAVGDYLVYGGILYRVTAAIANGGTITPGTNCSQTNTGAELSAIKDALTPTKIIPTSGIMVSYTSQIVTIYFNGYSATNNSSIGLPSVCYPWQIVRCPFMDTTDSSIKYLLINTDGNVLLRSVSGTILNSANITGTVSYSPNA